MQRMIQSLRQPVAQHRYLTRVPLLEKVQDPELIVHLAAYLVHIISRKVHVTLTKILTGSGHILRSKYEI